jgi:dGTPase
MSGKKVNIREQYENIEREVLSPHATLSINSKGRKEFEKKCEIRTEFQRDRDRIIHSKAFRRLKHKTQVFIAPEGDHYRTRLTHTLEVSQIARTLSRALRLNEDLTEAIALGHDLGHTPFGHTGETVLDKLHNGGFRHNEQSLKVVDYLEHNEKRLGLNLTYEVREGIKCHTGDIMPTTLEGKIVRIADRIAYINHDIDDAIRANIIKEKDLPKDCIDTLGHTHGDRINTMIIDVIKNSLDKDEICMSKEIEYYTEKLRDFMFVHVYMDSDAKREEDKAKYIMEQVYKYYIKNDLKLSKQMKSYYIENGLSKDDMVCDYVAGMTDKFVINQFYDIFVPKPWEKY